MLSHNILLASIVVSTVAADGLVPVAAVMPAGRVSSNLSNISHTLVGNKLVDHSDVVGALPVNKGQRQLQDQMRII